MEDVATGSVAVFIILKMLQNIYYLISKTDSLLRSAHLVRLSAAAGQDELVDHDWF